MREMRSSRLRAPRMTASDDCSLSRRVDRDEPLLERPLRVTEVAAGDAERLLVDAELVLDAPQLLARRLVAAVRASAPLRRGAAAGRARPGPARASHRCCRHGRLAPRPRIGPPRAGRSEVPRAQLAAAARAMTSSRPSQAHDGNKPAGYPQREPSRKCCNLAQRCSGSVRTSWRTKSRCRVPVRRSCSEAGDPAPRGSAVSPRALALTAASAALAAPGGAVGSAHGLPTPRREQLDTQAHQALLSLYALDSQLQAWRPGSPRSRAAAAALQEQRASLRSELGAARTVAQVGRRRLALELRALYERGDVNAVAVDARERPRSPTGSASSTTCRPSPTRASRSSRPRRPHAAACSCRSDASRRAAQARQLPRRCTTGRGDARGSGRNTARLRLLPAARGGCTRRRYGASRPRRRPRSRSRSAAAHDLARRPLRRRASASSS